MRLEAYTFSKLILVGTDKLTREKFVMQRNRTQLKTSWKSENVQKILNFDESKKNPYKLTHTTDLKSTKFDSFELKELIFVNFETGFTQQESRDFIRSWTS